MKKKQSLSPKILRQLEVISKYYEVDYENRIVTLELHYESVDEILVNDLVSKKMPYFKTAIIQRISEILESFPDEFTADIKLRIDDYKGYDPKVVLESFQDALEMFHYEVHNEKSARWVQAVILALVSVAILFVRKIGLDQSIISDSELITEMLDITAWVFLWQGVTVLFLNQESVDGINFKVISKINSISLLDKDEKKLLEINDEELSKDWIQITKKEKISKKFLLVSGAISFATGFTSGAQLFATIFEPGILSSAIGIIVVVIGGMDITLSVLGGIGAISLFKEKGPLQKAVPAVAYIYLLVDVLLVASVVSALVGTKPNIQAIIKTIITLTLSFGSSILYFISYLVLRRTKKREIRNYNKNKNVKNY